MISIVRYIDSGSRDPTETLGYWMSTLVEPDETSHVRWQTGFFGIDGIGLLVPMLQELGRTGGGVTALIGSNDGVTQGSDILRLLELAGPARENLKVGVVSFGNALFHPKTLHVTRSDGSMTAYVGSANLTQSGVALHVEAGILMDTRDGDRVDDLEHVADAIDWWFEDNQAGFYGVRDEADIIELTDARVLGVPRRPPVRPGGPARGSRRGSPPTNLKPLVSIPTAGGGLGTLTESSGEASSSEPSGASLPAAPTSRYMPAEISIVWGKQLSASDAQRKKTGNQRGSITLVASGYPINPQTYFRGELLASADWVEEYTSTGEFLERALVPMNVKADGSDLGLLDIPFTHAPNREAGQHNYTTALHIGPIAELFADNDLTGRRLTLARRTDGTFDLTIE